MKPQERPAVGARRAKIPERLVVGHNEGKAVDLGGIGVVFKLSRMDTQGAFSIVEHPMRPRTLVPPHLREATDEFSFVVEGRIGARIGDRILDATPGVMC